MTLTLTSASQPQPPQTLRPGVTLLRGWVDGAALAAEIAAVTDAAPFRRMATSWGKPLAAAMSNCGALGWVSDHAGYRYSPVDPQSGKPWPPLPAPLEALARRCAAAAGWPDFAPDACLINRYAPGAGMTAHIDRDEASFDPPIVSFSLGRAARFFVHESDRRSPVWGVDLTDGDALVWGGPARLMLHGVRPPRGPDHPIWGDVRINLTFRQAGGEQNK